MGNRLRFWYRLVVSVFPGVFSPRFTNPQRPLSLAADQKENAIGIILSGMGSDGALGVEAIAKHKGLVLVQAPESTEYKVMPYSAINADDPKRILPPSDLGRFLSEKYVGNYAMKG